jgi:hypothetical protein
VSAARKTRGHGARERAFAHPTNFSSLYSLLSTRSLFILPPPEGCAERRWRSDACEAPVSACHDRHADASLDLQAATTALRSLRTTGEPGLRSISAHRASPKCVRRLAVPATGRSPFGAPRGISGPGPCSPLSGGPSRIVRRPHSTHGSSLPGGAGLASLPGAAANRIRGRHTSLRLAGSPLEAPLMSEDGASIGQTHGEVNNNLHAVVTILSRTLKPPSRSPSPPSG